MRSALLSSAIALLAFATPAAAQNGTTAGTLELYPTFQSVGVRLGYSGDLNLNGTAHLEWRRTGASTWTVGVPMTRITGSRWAGSVMWLSSGTAYDVRAVVTDPDGGVTATGSVTTRSDPPTTPSGRTWWVATNGNDTNSGTLSAPLATLAQAANNAQPGDEIRVKPGIYYQTLDTPRAGTASAPIHLVADGPGVRLDGSDPAFLKRSDWSSDGSGIYSVPYTGSTMLVAADSLQRLYHQASLSALQTNANGVAQGWAVEGGRLYLKLEDGSSPNNHTIHVARFNQAIYVDQSYWRIDGFDVRYCGLTTSGGGIVLINANGVVVTHNNLYVNGGRSYVLLRTGTSNALIANNQAWDARVSTWPWAAVKAHDEENNGVSNRGARGNVIRQNSVDGLFNGIDVTAGDTDENVGTDCDLHDNVLTHLGDDALETDVISAINLRVFQNRVDRVFSGFSIAPNYQGPEYVLYNTITNTTRGGFKFSISSTGETWIAHNTLTGDVSGSAAVHPSGPWSNMHFVNNILVGNNSAAVSDDAGESASGNTFDGDLVYSNYAALFRWKGTNYSTLSALRSGTGFEMNGKAGDPKFMSAAGGDYRLQTGSPAIDAGMRLPGINDMFSGAAPDIGAYELNGGPDVIAPAAITDLH
jgi:hypothetical protein